MSNIYNEIKIQLQQKPKVWLVTGVAGFIGSNLLEHLLKLDQYVIGIDNFRTGKRENLQEIQTSLSAKTWSHFRFIKGDITNPADCLAAMHGVDYVLHQAAIGSVPLSIEDPSEANLINVGGFINVLEAAKNLGVKRVIYASSSAVYGTTDRMPLTEDNLGEPLSPYAVNKHVNELYANTFARNYGLEGVGLRYFNVFGKRQDPNGTYAAVIPQWIETLLSGKQCQINGDGTTSRDFVHIDDVVQANLLAATAPSKVANQVYNIGNGKCTNLNELYKYIYNGCSIYYPPEQLKQKPIYASFRKGDVKHSQANINKATEKLKYNPQVLVSKGLESTIAWYSRLIERKLAA